jgi:CRP/FNR family transcriptional regulator, nitrogen fixation regulation protein
MYASSFAATVPATRGSAPAHLVLGRSGSIPGSADALEQLGATITYKREQAIYFEGDEAENCYRVRSGTVRLCKVTEDGRRQIAAFLTAGDFFGWDEGEYGFSAEAVTDAKVEKFQRRRIDRAMTDDPALGRRIMAVLSGQLSCAHQHVMLLGRMTAYERVATFLLDLAGRRRQSPEGDRTVELAMNRRDLADYLGLTVETVSRVMNGLKRKGVIFFTAPEDVHLKQSDALERMALAA